MNLPKFEISINSAKLKDSETFFVLDSLATMLGAGIPILEALASISEDSTNPTTKKMVQRISDSVNSGKSLAESFSLFPQTFDEVFLSIVKSGEASGNLDKVLRSAAENLKKTIATKGDIKSAIFYPAIIVGVLLLVAFFVFGYSLPQVAKVFFDLHLKLPPYSAAVLHLALWFGTYKLYLLGALVILVFIFYLLMKIKVCKQFVLGIFFKLPLVSKISRYLDLARFTQTTGLLLKSGVPIINALEISQGVVISNQLKADIAQVRENLTKGVTLEKSMKTAPKSFPSLLRRVVGVGEESGNLDKSLTDISDFYEKNFSDIIKNLTVIIEPILIILIAALVALVLVSVVLPIYQGIGTINHH